MGTKESIEATCPDCRGPLSVLRTGSLVEFRCLVGHAYSARGLLAAHSDTQERALWSAVVALREAATLVSVLGDQFTPDVMERLNAQVRKKQADADVLQKILESLEPFEA